jgi:hypothetical protein
MSNKKISELELVASNASGDQFPLVQNGETMKTTMSKIATFLGTIFTTTAAVAAQITAAITGKEDVANKQNSLNADATNTKYPTVTATNTGLAAKLNLSGGTMSGNIAMNGFVISDLSSPSDDNDASTKKYTDAEVATRQLEYNLANTATGASAVTINATSGVATFTQVLTRKTSANYNINNTSIALDDKIEFSLYYTGAGYPLIMHYSTIANRIILHIANVAVDGGSGVDTNANLVVTFRKI